MRKRRTNKPYFSFVELGRAPRIQSGGKKKHWYDDDFFHSFTFYLSRKQAHFRDVYDGKFLNDLSHSVKVQVARLLHELKNRKKNIPKTSPTRYIESGCGWAANIKSWVR